MVLDPTDLDTRFVNEADHDKAAHDALALSHDSLSDVSVDDHHAQAHTLASHSTKAHGELTDVGAGDHHAEFIPATNFPKHVFLPAQAMAHRGTWGSWGNCKDSGLGAVGREMTPLAGDCGYIEGAFYVQNFQAITATLKIWYVYEDATTDAGTVNVWLAMHNTDDSGWNLLSNDAQTFNWVGDHILKYNYISLSDADLSGSGWFSFAFKFSGMNAEMHNFVGVTLEYTTDHA